MTKQLEGLCPHGRLTTAVCLDCGIEAELYKPENKDFPDSFPDEVGGFRPIDWDGPDDVLTPKCEHDVSIDQHCPECFLEVQPDKRSSGMNAPYYDIPEWVKDTQDLIEWLERGGLRWSCINMLKSIIREYNPDASKETSALYEAEKRFYYADRHLRQVQARTTNMTDYGS
jgi:hypothetical protein